MTRPRIGFIGLGIMGHPMSGHLAKAGFDLTVFDSDATAVDHLHEIHPSVAIADNPAGVGASSDIVFTMLPDGACVQEVALGSGGLIETMASGSLLLDTSSAQPWLTSATALKLAERGIRMVDAPVSGAQWGAEQANLVFMVGGAPARSARPSSLSLRSARFGPRDEEHQQHHHCDDVPGHGGRARAWQARRSRSRCDE